MYLPGVSPLVALLFIASFLGVQASVAPEAGECDPSYVCEYEVEVNHFKYHYDLSTLCTASDLITTDKDNNVYNFRICGYASKLCRPEGGTTVEHGVAVMSWGTAPPCSTTQPQCFDIVNQTQACCTEPCQVLGVYDPRWSLIDPTNPREGGLRAVHVSVPSSCGVDPKHGTVQPMEVHIELYCDASRGMGNPKVLEANETAPCVFTIPVLAEEACGCSHDLSCLGRNCGHSDCPHPRPCGFCPEEYECALGGTCCRSDCRGRQCGDDGCGQPCGECPDFTVCSEETFQCEALEPSPPPQDHPSDAGAIAGSFFGGFFTMAVIGGLSLFAWHKGIIHRLCGRKQKGLNQVPNFYGAVDTGLSRETRL